MYSFSALGRSTGALPSGGVVFPLVCHFHRYWAYSSKSTVQPKIDLLSRQSLFCLFPPSPILTLIPSLLCPTHPHLSSVPWKRQAWSYPRAFDLAVTVAWNVFSPDLYMWGSFLFSSQCKWCLIRDHPWPHQPRHSPYNVILWLFGLLSL